MDIGYFLKLMTDKNASDMFLTTGAPVHIKVEGKLYPLGNTGLPPGMVKKIAYSLMDEGQVPDFERDLELNMALSLADAGRFRVNVFKQRGCVAISPRVFPIAMKCAGTTRDARWSPSACSVSTASCWMRDPRAKSIPRRRRRR